MSNSITRESVEALKNRLLQDAQKERETPRLIVSHAWLKEYDRIREAFLDKVTK